MGGFARGLQNVGTITKTVMIAIAGGTASVLGGGKFANGAMSAAFVFMFNEMARKTIALDARSKKKLQEILEVSKLAKGAKLVLVVGKYTVDLIRGNPISDILEMKSIAKGGESSWESVANSMGSISAIANRAISVMALDMVMTYKMENNFELSTFWEGIYNAH